MIGCLRSHLLCVCVICGRNNSYGHYNIALLYADGLGTLRQDTKKSLQHFLISAELGHPS
jgi:TPR repeat protein